MPLAEDVEGTSAPGVGQWSPPHPRPPPGEECYCCLHAEIRIRLAHNTPLQMTAGKGILLGLLVLNLCTDVPCTEVLGL
jgi:hypothetical protein